MDYISVNNITIQAVQLLIVITILSFKVESSTPILPGTSQLGFNSTAWFISVSGGDIPIEKKRSKDCSPKGYMKKLFHAIQEDPLVNADQSVSPKVRFTSVDLGKRSKRRYIRRIEFDNSKSLRRPISYAEIVLNDPELAKTEIPLIAKVSTNGSKGIIEARKIDNFFIFNVSGLVSDSTPRVTCRFKQPSLSDKCVKISLDKELPILVTYEHRNENPLLRSKNRAKRDFFWNRPLPGGAGSTQSWSPSHCKRFPWTVNMELFNFRWFLHPIRYDAGFCHGICPIPLESRRLNITNHSYVKNLYHANTEGMDDSVPFACCSPTEYESMPVYYINSDEIPVISILPNMKVTACGCR